MISLDYQDTRSEEIVEADWACGRTLTPKVRLAPRRHYRVVLGTAGYPLERIEGTKELLHATFDAFQGTLHACL